MKIEVTLKTVWGKQLFYPVSSDAQKLCDVIGRPTLSLHHLHGCQKVGWAVTIRSETYNLDELEKKLCT